MFIDISVPDVKGGDPTKAQIVPDQIDKGAEQIIEFVNKVSNIPNVIDEANQDLNDYLIGVGQKIGAGSKEVATENLRRNKLSGIGSKVGKWLGSGSNALYVIGGLILIFILRK